MVLEFGTAVYSFASYVIYSNYTSTSRCLAQRCYITKYNRAIGNRLQLERSST